MEAESQPVYLITGASRGIGRALSEHYARAGFSVYGVSRGPSTLQHKNYHHIRADLCNLDAARQTVSDVARDAGRIDVLINNAGVKADAYAVLLTAEQALAMLNTNVLGAFYATREALKVMKRNRFGRVVSFSSIAVPLASAGTAMYGASKAALEQLMITLAREHARDNITLNTIGISSIAEGEMFSDLSGQAKADLDRSLPKPSVLKIDELVHVIDFLVSDLAGNITGQTIYFGGLK